MRTNGGITFNVGINVDDETVTRAVNILTWYCIDNQMTPVISKEDGSLIIQITKDNGHGTCPTCGRSLEPPVVMGFANGCTSDEEAATDDKQEQNQEVN